MPRFRPTIADASRALAVVLCALVAGCGGHGAYNGNNSGDNPAGAPSAPLNLVANAGDQAISLGWNVPTTNASGSISYQVTISPAPSGSTTTVSGTTALIRGLSNNVSYTVSVTASNAAGTSPAASTQSKPATVSSSNYTALLVTNDPLSNGVADPSLLRTTGGRIWMAYSDVDASGSGPILSSAVRLAHSDDGISYSFDKEIGAINSTGLATGTWNYRTPWLVEDDADPDASRRFKLFAQKYFFDSNSNTPKYEQSAIVMWTAASPDGTWSSEETVLGWTSTPAALLASRLLGQIDSSLQTCLWADEGSATVDANGIELALSCALTNDGISRKIVLLRSADNAASFTFVSAPLTADNAATYNASSFSMPALLPGGGAAPVLIASPIDAFGNALGCVVFPLSDAKAGTLFEVDNAPLALQILQPFGSDNGGCAWDRGIANGGILMNDRNGSTYTILKTGKSL